MSFPDGNTTLTLNDPQAEEDKMRAALGLTPENPHPSRPVEQSRHRPSRDSEVSVPILSPRRLPDTADGVRGRLAALESAMQAERSERVAAQQALADAQRVIQQLQTKLAHSEIAAAEALKVEQTARLAAEARLQGIISAGAPKPTAEPAAGTRKRGRPPGKKLAAEMPEPKPVQWWLPSYAASKAKRGRSQT